MKKPALNFLAFTLLEMIVSLSIIMIISVLFITNYRSANRRTDLIMTAQTLVADIHFAQNNTLGLVKYGPVVPPGGWGVSFDKAQNSYTVFADLNAPETPGYLKYDLMPEDEGDKAYGAREINLSSEIEINELKLIRGATSTLTDLANVSFLPPDPKTNLYNVTTDSTSTVLEIKLKDKNANSFKTIRVNFLGLVEVVD
jgi:type II secretory pathway pseudopilin PulG